MRMIIVYKWNKWNYVKPIATNRWTNELSQYDHVQYDSYSQYEVLGYMYVIPNLFYRQI